MTIKAIYIDDEIDRENRNAQKLRDLLMLPEVLEITLQYPPTSFTEIDFNFDLVLVDLDLSSPSPTGDVAGYYGTTLAAELRMRNPSSPIVLITRPNLLIGKNQLLTDNIDVDQIIYKDDINRNPTLARNIIIGLYEGFNQLAGAHRRDWNTLISLMKATEEEADLLREAAPPVEKGLWEIPQIARWIRNTVLRYPGIMYDELTSATRLGLSLASFQEPRVQSFFEKALYTGIFSTLEQRWWRGRLFYLAQELVLKHKLHGSLFESFSKAFYTEFGVTLTPAVCVYDGQPTADWVCYILKQPVKQSHSIPYYPDRRPSVMDQARVSFKAIQESDAFDETLVDASSFEIVKNLWK